MALFACAATAATHWSALSANAYSFDDSQYLLKNPLVQHPGWPSAKRFLTEVLEPSTVAGYYQPLAMISLMLDAAMGGRPDHLRPFHRTSLAFHVANTGLVIVLLHALFRSAWPAALVGLLFGLHPLAVEPIPWIGERKTVLSTFFALICLNLYVKYARRDPATGANSENRSAPSSEPRAPLRVAAKLRWPTYAGSLLAFVLALMSKPTTTPIPVLLLLIDYWPLRRLSRKTVLEKAPWFALACVSAVITYVSQARTASVTLPQERPASWAPLTICHNIVFYLTKMVWPANLSSHYPFPDPMSLAHPMVLAGVVGTAVLIAALLYAWHRTPAPLTGWLFFFIAIFPTLGVIGFTDVIASDKFAYLPALGLLMVLAAWVTRIWNANDGAANPARRRAMIAGLFLLVAAGEATATRRYLRAWQDTDTFWQHMMDHAPRASMLRSSYAGFLFESGRLEEAAQWCQRALELDPANYAALNALGGIAIRQARYADAVPYLQEALRARPDDPNTGNNLAMAYLRLGRTKDAVHESAQATRLMPLSAEIRFNYASALARDGQIEPALEQCAEAVRLNPHWAEPRNQLGVLLAGQGQLDAATTQFVAAIRIKPDWDEPRRNLGAALAQLNRVEEAIEQYQAALTLNPALADVHFNLANALVLSGRPAEAVPHYREAARLSPTDAQAHQHLAQILFKEGDIEGAIAAYGQALRIKPDWPEAHNDLGALLARQGRIAEAIPHFQEAVRLRPDWPEAKRNLETAQRPRP